MDEEMQDSPLDLSVPRSDAAALLRDAGGLVLNNSFSWPDMAEALSWSDQLLRVKSVMTIAQLEQDWKDEEEDDQQPWRFDDQFEVLKPSEEEVNVVVSESELAMDESRSLEEGDEFHIFGGEDLSINKSGSQKQDQTAESDISTNQSAYICQMLSLEETPQESPSANLVPEVAAEQLGAECQAVLAPPPSAEEALLLGSTDGREELVVTHVTLLPSSENLACGNSLLEVPSKEVESLVDGLATKELVVIECQTPCEEANHDQLLEERDEEKDSNECQGGRNTLAEQAGHGLCQSEILGIDLFKRKVSSDSVFISEVSRELAEKGTLETVLVQCWKVP